MSVASLPMYDWPEVRVETDALWRALQQALRARALPAPEILDRLRESRDVWRDRDLVLSQTCGMPWRLDLYRHTRLVGTPDYGVDGCRPGYYRSMVVVRAGDARTTLEAFAGATCAVNGFDSQSGYAALAELVGRDRCFGDWLETGAHRASIDAVAQARGDIAAIDAVTWRLARRFQPQASKLRVLMTTPPTPGLPFITGKAHDAETVFAAVTDALAVLPDATRDALGLHGIVKIPPSDYFAVGTGSLDG
ncbi:MAG: phosphate/phosphite/phosphonate ABC transporter substrate-binding protein [Hyphomicrobiaceae bacterium]